MSRRRTVLRLAAAAGAARLCYGALTRRPPGGEQTWTRTNHRGEPLTLLEGPAVTAGAVAAALAVPGLTGTDRAALVIAGAGGGVLGCYDDLAGSSARHGFSGHLGALARGEVTTGAVKIAGIGAAGLAAGVLLSRARRGGPAGRLADIVIDAGLTAGGANLLNLFDLRPGRAIKVALLAGGALAVSGPEARAAAAAPVGAALALLPDDLGETAMLGDAGANAIGAMLGAAAASTLPRAARVGALAVIAALTAASEKVSFTAVIKRTPALDWIDMLGRRPTAAPSPAMTASPAGQPSEGTPASANGRARAGKQVEPTGPVRGAGHDGAENPPAGRSTPAR